MLLEIINFKGIKTRSIKKENYELTIRKIHHNIKKIPETYSNKFLKFIYNVLKNLKEKRENMDFLLLKKLKKKS